MGFKKKLYELDPENVDKEIEVKILRTRREQVSAKVVPQSNERYFREQLANKVSGSHMGLWLLVPELARLGAWDLLKGLFRDRPDTIAPHLAMQLVNESALCVNRIRKKDSLCHQGFSLVNGLSFLAADESVHDILDSRTVSRYEDLQKNLLRLRMLDGHYSNCKNRVLAIDPHRIPSYSQRIMAKKKKRPEAPAQKMMQTFFCNDVTTKQPLAFTMAASGKTCTQATLQLLEMIENAGIKDALVLADKEHYSEAIVNFFSERPGLDILMPALNNKKMVEGLPKLDYQRLWAGYSIAESTFGFASKNRDFRLIVQREGEIENDYVYKPFVTTSNKSAKDLLAHLFPRRWKIEEFFNFEGDMGWNRASTFNLNIKYGKQTLALLAQAALHKLRKNLPMPYENWTAAMLSEKVFTNMEGDIRVKDDFIVITYYKDHEHLNLKDKYSNISCLLENENVSPKIPWLFDYKLLFRFK
jgi:hypothetical protein